VIRLPSTSLDFAKARDIALPLCLLEPVTVTEMVAVVLLLFPYVSSSVCISHLAHEFYRDYKKMRDNTHP
jgi:hypothetical protein